MGLEALGEFAIYIILSKLTPKEVAAVGCVSRMFKLWAYEDAIWSNFCSQELDLSAPLDPQGNPVASFKETYQIWRQDFATYPWPLVKRVKRCWGTLRNWLTTNFSEAEATLRKGASEAEISELECSLKVKLPLPTRLLYRFCDGQDIPSEGSALGGSLGLIGGYSVYRHVVDVYLLPLRQVVSDTMRIISELGFSSRSKYIVVATSSTYISKLFFLNCSNGQLYVGTKNLATDGEMIPCVPSALINSVHNINGDQQQDGMLLWLEEHGRRLQNGIIQLRDEGKFKRINLFPEVPPLCSVAVTHGVQVRASAVFVPEGCDLQNMDDKYLFAYSIRMCLLPVGCVVHGLSFSCCQLYWRHWIIKANDTVVSDVSDEAVIGKYPLLQPGKKEFVYESWTTLPSGEGSIEGAFTFVPGRLADPKGRPFEVDVARLPLLLPDYIF